MRRKLFINIVADFPDGTNFSEEDLGALKEDIEDAVYWNGVAKPVFPGVNVEVEQR